jgi:hypothetical protein
MLWKLLGFQKLFDALFDDNWLGVASLKDLGDDSASFQDLLTS